MLRKRGPVIEIDMEALILRRRKIGYPKSRGISRESEKQHFAADSTRASRQSERTQRRIQERIARASIREERLIASLVERQLNPMQDGNASRTAENFNALHSLRQGSRASIKAEENSENSKERPHVSGEDTRCTGVVVGSKNAKNEQKIARVQEDGILLVVPARINGKTFFALIDSGATRCFVTPDCVTVAGLACVPQDTFLELGNGTKALSRGMV